MESGQRALAFARALGDFALEVSTNFYLGRTYHALGDYRRAIEALSLKALSPADEAAGERVGVRGNPSGSARPWLVCSLAEIGAFAEGITRGKKVVQIAEDANVPVRLIGAYLGIEYLYVVEGDLSEAISQLERGLELCRTWNFPGWLPPTASALGFAYALSGRITEALGLLEQAVEEATSMRLLISMLPGPASL